MSKSSLFPIKSCSVLWLVDVELHLLSWGTPSLSSVTEDSLSWYGKYPMLIPNMVWTIHPNWLIAFFPMKTLWHHGRSIHDSCRKKHLESIKKWIGGITKTCRTKSIDGIGGRVLSEGWQVTWHDDLMIFKMLFCCSLEGIFCQGIFVKLYCGKSLDIPGKMKLCF